jgi:magnesium transporter
VLRHIIHGVYEPTRSSWGDELGQEAHNCLPHLSTSLDEYRNEMSGHQDGASVTGYGTSLSELDDHCHQVPAVQRPDGLHTRRSILNSLHGTRLDTDQANPSRPCTPDGEDAVAEDGHDVAPGPPRSRRLAAASSERLSISPPNSVKAFAEARRRGQELSFAEPKGVDRREGERRDNDDGIARTVSVGSRRHTADHDSARLTTKSPEEDVCYPVPGEHHEDNLYIDFDLLETLIESETHQEAAVRVFPSLLPASTVPSPLPIVASVGDFINVPSDLALSLEKEVAGHNLATAQQQHADLSRFSFFSSAWESTIHSAQFGGLVPPGECVQDLFSFPGRESDGVWWLNLNNPTGEEVRTIAKAFGIHPLTIEDIIAQENREKIELFPSYYFACFGSFRSVDRPDGINYTPFTMYVVVFREGTLSFSFAPNDHAPRVRARISMLKEYVSVSSDWICYALM